MRKLSLAALALSVGVAAPAAAQLQEAPLPQIFESYNDCFAATESGEIDTDALTDLGWARASMTDGDGKAIDDGPIIYGHGERAPIILLIADEGAGACVVTARIESLDVWKQFTSAFGDKLPEADEAGAISFLAQGRIVQIAPTGSRKEPSMRLLVATPMERN